MQHVSLTGIITASGLLHSFCNKYDKQHACAANDIVRCKLEATRKQLARPYAHMRTLQFTQSPPPKLHTHTHKTHVRQLLSERAHDLAQQERAHLQPMCHAHEQPQTRMRAAKASTHMLRGWLLSQQFTNNTTQRARKSPHHFTTPSMLSTRNTDTLPNLQCVENRRTCQRIVGYEGGGGGEAPPPPTPTDPQNIATGNRGCVRL